MTGPWFTVGQAVVLAAAMIWAPWWAFAAAAIAVIIAPRNQDRGPLA